MKKKAVEKKKKDVTLDDLALMVAKGFQSVDANFAVVNHRFDTHEKRLENLEKGQQKIHNDILNIGDKFVPRCEF